MSGGPTQITPPLISRTTGVPTVFMVSPILDEKNRPQGLIGAGISLKYIQQIAQELRAGTSGYGIITAKDGTFIYHPENDRVMRQKLSDTDSDSEKELGRLMLSGGSGMYRYMSGHEKMVAFYQSIPIAGWAAATILPERELFAPAIKMTRLLSAIAVLFAIAICTAIILAMRRLTRPLQTLSTRAEEIAQGNLDGERLEISSNDEIGKLSQSFNIMTDNLKKTLSELKESEDNYRGIFEHSVSGILQTTLNGKLLNANPALGKILKYSPDHSQGSYPETVKDLYANPEDRKQIISQLLKEGSIENFETQALAGNGEKVWVLVSSYLVKDSSGEPLHIESMVTDISERKQAEADKEKLSQQLAQAQRLDAVGKLAGGVAHDFNNMLAVILGHTELALMNMQSDEKHYPAFVDIQNAAEHSVNLTRQLLTFARKQTVAPKVIDLHSTITDISALLRRLIPEDVELVQTSAEHLWTVNIDPDQVNQILTNLCVNARDAIQGNGRISIETKNITLDQTYSQHIPDLHPGDYVCLSVSDNGSGMDKETLQHLFEPFYTTKSIQEGTGLGLATVYGIVKQNNALINVYSEPGLGTTFNIYIPKYGGQCQPSLSPSPASLAINLETVVIVEDEQQFLDVTKEILEVLGCRRVLAFNSPHEAIEAIEKQTLDLDLLITDVVMPKMNGRELVSRISNLRPDIRCLFMSGYTSDIIAHKGVLERGINFIHKPFSLQALAEKIREVMSQPPRH